MNPQPVNALSGPVLRAIHMPPAAGWWPLAPGWWVLAAIVLVVLVLLTVHLHRRRLPLRRWQAARAELDALCARQAEHADAAAFAAGVSQLLRRAARIGQPETVAFQGETWHRALLRLAPAAEVSHPLVSLDEAIYRPHPALEVDATAEAARRWLRHVLLGGGHRD